MAAPGDADLHVSDCLWCTFTVTLTWAEPSVLPVKAGVLQHPQKTAADVLLVCGDQRPLLCCGLLGSKQPEETPVDWTDW